MSRSNTVIAWRWVAPTLALLLVASTAVAQPAPDTVPPPARPGAAVARIASANVVEIFVREGCPHCEDAEVFLADLARERPDVRIVVRDVGRDPSALARLKELARTHAAGMARVPATFVGGQLIVGYSREANTGELIRGALAGAQTAAAAPGAATCDAEESLSCVAPQAEPGTPPQKFEITLFGRTIALDDVGLPAFTLAMGLLDGFNPCSMWVLVMMISLLAPLNDRRRMLAVAGTFVVIEGIAYFAFMAAWLNLFLFIGLSRASQLVVAALAIVAGTINIKDFWAFGRGISLSIPERAKPGIYARMRSILHADNLAAAIVATVILALLVQLVELLCTSGFPALFTRILTLRELEGPAYYGYLLLYNAAYMLDDVIVLAIGVITLSRHRLQEKEGRWLKLVAGLVMIALGVYLAVDG